MSFDMLHTSNPLPIPHVTFRSILPEDGEADPILQGLHPGDEARALPHFNRRFPLHNRGDSGKCKRIREAFLRRDSPRYRKQGSPGFCRSMLIRSVEKSTYWKLLLQSTFELSLEGDTGANWSGCLSLLGWFYGFWHIWFRPLPLLRTLQCHASARVDACFILASQRSCCHLSSMRGLGRNQCGPTSAASSAASRWAHKTRHDWLCACFLSDHCSWSRVTSCSSALTPQTWGITSRILCWPSWWVGAFLFWIKSFP